MKNLMSKAIVSVCICLTLCLSALWTTGNCATNQFEQQTLTVQELAASYSWSSHAGAISYQVVLTPRGSGSTFTFNTASTSISLAGVPSGVYTVKVDAILTKGSTTIIVEDLIIT